MRISLTILIPALLSLSSCTNDKTAVKVESAFKKPVIAQSFNGDTLLHHTANDITDSYFMVALKSSTTDTLRIPAPLLQDTSIADHINRNRFDTLWNNISYDAFEVVPDYNSAVYKQTYHLKGLFCFYPIYIINKSAVVKYFPGKDSYAFGIQEAVDSTGTWRPIEGQGFDFCGNGHWRLTMQPNEFVMLLVPKYKGSYRTSIRARIKIGNMVYVSAPFEGVIAYEQFMLKTDSYHQRLLHEDQAAAIQDIFYGAIPVGRKSKSPRNHAVYPRQN